MMNKGNYLKNLVGSKSERKLALGDEITPLISEDERKVSFILVSDSNERQLYDFFEDKTIVEKLDVNGARLDRLHSVYYNHKTYELPIGKTENKRVDNGQIKADVIFDDDDQSDKVFRKILGGFLRSGSIGYIVNSYKKEERDNVIHVTVTDYDVVEFSITGIPADGGAVVGRSNELIEDVAKNIKETKKMNVEISREEILKEERGRIMEIRAAGEKFDMKKEADEFIREGKTSGEFNEFIINRFEDKISKNKLVNSNSADIGLSKKEVKRFSFLRACMANLQKDSTLAEFEMECSRAVEKKLGRASQGFYVPNDVLTSKRAEEITPMNTFTPTEGGSFVPNVHRPESFIDVLRNRMLLKKMGAQEISGLTGNVTIPKLTSGSEAYFVKEGQRVQKSKMTTGVLDLNMKTIMAGVPLTRSMIMNSSPSMDNLALNDIARSLALGIDKVGLLGKKEDGPVGILSTPGIKGSTIAKANTEVTWKNIVELESNVASQNADINTMYYVVSAVMRGILKTTEKVKGYPQFLIGDDGRMNGYDVGVTNQILNNITVFGDFSNLLIALWGALDILVDPYSESSSGNINIYAYQGIDLGVRHEEGFSYLMFNEA